MMQQPDTYYIDKVLGGDTNSYAVLVNRYKDMVFTIVNRIVRNRENAEEIAQDVFLKAFQSLANYQGKSKFSTWLYRIAFNAAISKTRKKNPELNPVEEDIIENYTNDSIIEDSDGMSFEDKKKYVEAALQKLPAEDNLLLTLFYLEEQSIDEISEISGLSGTNVKVRLHRTRKKLYRQIEEMRKYRLGKHIE